VDRHGILRRDEERRRWRYRRPTPDPDKFKIGDRNFERINHCWFEVWYEYENKGRRVWNYWLQRHEIEYSIVEVRVRQRQLSKKELRDLDLSNDPDFKWWEA